jgi:Leucine-rich repeat (LRR) protein
VGQNVLAATLGRLRCLRVEYLQDAPEPAQLVQLLASTTQLTRLVLHRGLQEAHARPLLEALQTTQLPAPPAATAAATAAAAAAGASDMPAVGMLPALNQLVMEAPPTGLLPAWLDSMHPATRLTSLHLSSRRGAPEELHPLPSCTALQELAVSVLSGSGGGTLELPQGLTRLTALTKLELAAQLGGPDVDLASRVIWDLGALQHLRLSDPGSNTLDCIPASISRLPQLRVLSVQGTSLTELPRELGTWLPRLEELDVSDTYIGAVPPGLTRLTRLDASGTEVTRVTAVTHLVTLKELVLERSVLSPPLQRLTQLSALESLAVGWESEVLGAEEAGEVCVPGPLPALHTLQLSGWAPSRPEQLAGVVGAQQLTHLRLCVDDKLGPQQAIAALTQLGMLPQLQELELHSIWTDTAWFDPAPRLQQLALDEDKRGATTLVAAAPWLQQQPRLVSLALAGFDVCGALLLRLPPQLEELHLDHCWLVGQQPSALSQLSRLRKLLLNCHGRQQAPPWLSSLHRLEGLAVYGDSAGPGDGSWRGVLAQLPALSHVDVSPWQALCALRDAPHLCWACE